jgi:hypothetical protein
LAASTHRGVPAAPGRRPRLFVPLNSDPFQWFKNGRKRWELRTAARGFAPRFLTPGRRVELRKGYNGQSLWGVLGRHYVATSIASLFKRVPFRKVAPYAVNAKEAERLGYRLLGKQKQYVVFEVRLRTSRIIGRH